MCLSCGPENECESFFREITRVFQDSLRRVNENSVEPFSREKGIKTLESDYDECFQSANGGNWVYFYTFSRSHSKHPSRYSDPNKHASYYMKIR